MEIQRAVFPHLCLPMAPDLSINFPAVLQAWLMGLQSSLTDPRALFWWPTLLTAVVGAGLAAWMGWRVTRGGWFAFMRQLPVDVSCYLGYTLTQALVGKFLFWATAGGAMAVFLVFGVPGRIAVNPAWGERLAVAGMVFVMGDLFLYWSHRLFHHFRALWWFHKLHHNPPVLTPITAFRFWPPEAAVHFAAYNLGEGLALGLASYAFGMQITAYTWLGINVFLVAWYLGFSHLRHSHVALAYPRWLSHVLVSPHMHQAHHSVDPQHHHRNFGTALALWDWLFHTLYIPAREERFRFGVAREEPAPQGTPA